MRFRFSWRLVLGLSLIAVLGLPVCSFAQANGGSSDPSSPETQKISVAASVQAALDQANVLVEDLENPETDEDTADDKYAAAVKLTNRILELEPLNVRARYLQGRLAMVSGRPRDALPLIEAYVNDPAGATDWYARVLLGDLYVMSYPKHARTQYQEASKLAPDQAKPYIGMAITDVKLNRGEEAVEEAREAILYDKEQKAEYRKTLADAFLLMDDHYDDAARAAREAVDLAERKVREDPTNLSRLGELKSYYDLLISCYKGQFERYPERTEVLVSLVRSTLDKADLERLMTYHTAEVFVEEARKQPSFKDSADLLYEEARLNRLIGDDKRAMEALTELLKRNPNHGPGKELLGIIQSSGKLAGNEATTSSSDHPMGTLPVKTASDPSH